MLRRLAALNINFDSVGEATGFSRQLKEDPAFTRAADRFLALARKYKFKYSIYVVGKDLLRKDHQRQVKNWSEMGHEIGNHSWSHLPDLGSLTENEIFKEVEQTHELITNITKIPPRGFISPSWATSSRLLRVLGRFGYKYDTSSFPSWLMLPTILKLFVNRSGNKDCLRILNRKDWRINLYGHRKRYEKNGVIVLPLPTNKWRIACWHTLGFKIGWDNHKKILRECLKELDDFYYLVHPADLLEERDLANIGMMPRWERIEVPLEEKLKRLEEMVEIILNSGRRIVTMRRLADSRRHIS